jgi:peptidoglycan/LPS O-acetylase OafA/YrhL
MHRWPADPMIATLLMPVLVWLAACTPLEGKARQGALYLGLLSYPLYALHGVVRDAIGYAAGVPQPQPLWVPVATFFVSIMIAAAASRHFDEPVRNWLMLQWKSRYQRTVARS